MNSWDETLYREVTVIPIKHRPGDEYSVYTHELSKPENDGTRYVTEAYLRRGGKIIRTLHTSRYGYKKLAVEEREKYVKFYRDEATRMSYDACSKCGLVHGEGGCLD